jgi:hypothetical protein
MPIQKHTCLEMQRRPGMWLKDQAWECRPLHAVAQRVEREAIDLS